MQLTKVRVSRKNQFGEYVVLAYGGAPPKRYPPADYFTTDLTDAKNTARLMLPLSGQQGSPNQKDGSL